MLLMPKHLYEAHEEEKGEAKENDKYEHFKDKLSSY
jgi:hypothetical protein